VMDALRQTTENRVYGMAASISILTIDMYWIPLLFLPLTITAILLLNIRRRMIRPTDTKLLSAKDAVKNAKVVEKPNGKVGWALCTSHIVPSAVGIDDEDTKQSVIWINVLLRVANQATQGMHTRHANT
jgi:hypothetical protein